MKVIIIAALLLVIGAFIGWGVHSTWFCQSAAKGTINQIKADGKKLDKAREKIKVKYVYRTKIKRIIQKIPAGECFDRPIPDDAANLLRDALRAEGSTPDRTLSENPAD